MIRNFLKRHKSGTVLLGDIAVFFASLALMLLVRYGRKRSIGAFHTHVGPFSLLLVIWLLVFYIADLYTYTTWRTTYENGKRFALALLVNFFLSISMFYLFGGFFKLTPKLNLILFTVIFGVLDCTWRYALARVLASKNSIEQILVLANSPLAQKIAEHARSYPELSYAVSLHADPEALKRALSAIESKTTVVIDTTFLKDPAVLSIIYGSMSDEVRIETLANFYAAMFGRVPLSEITEERFLTETRPRQRTPYDIGKRATDVALSLVLLVIFSPLFLIFAIAIAATSPGSPIYRQTRVGKGGVPFTLYKFRSMRVDAEKNGPVWWKKDDDRTTKVGAFLRRTHLDELPQLWNILRGDMSFVGPRPERPEFLETLKAQIPHYLVRETIQPGLTGWAQIKFRYAGSIMDWQEKFEYDLYYVENRSFLIDAGVIAKTVQFVFSK